MMVFWYIVSTILIVLGAVELMRGAYLLCRGVLQKDNEDLVFGGLRVAFACSIAFLFWMIDLVFGVECLRWLKMFISEHTDIFGL